MRHKVGVTALHNAERTGYDRLDMRAGDQGTFVKRLAAEDLREALRLGWKITLRGRPVIGGMWAVADFRVLGQPRYDISFYREPDGRAVARARPSQFHTRPSDQYRPMSICLCVSRPEELACLASQYQP